MCNPANQRKLSGNLRPILTATRLHGHWMITIPSGLLDETSRIPLLALGKVSSVTVRILPTEAK